MEQLVARTRESSSVVPLDDPDIEMLTGEYLPLLLQTAGAISADWAACQAAPSSSSPVAAVCPLSGRVDDPRPAGGGPQPPAPADRPRYPLPCVHARQG